MAAVLSFDSAYRQVKRGELAPVYYLTGSEDVLKDELVGLILDRAVVPESRDFNLDVRQAADLNGESLHALVETPPLLTERRVVVIKNLEQWRSNAKVWRVLERYVANPSPTTVLVLTHGTDKPRSELEQHAVHVGVDPLNPARTARWVNRRAERAGLALDGEAAQHLVRAVGGELAQLGMEIEKLAAAYGNQPLTVEEVAQFVGVRRGETVSDWVNAILIRRIARAVAMLETVLGMSGVTGVRLLGTLGTALIGLRLARTLLDGGLSPGRVQSQVFNQIRAARPAGLGSWRTEAATWTAAAKHWTEPELEHAIRTAYEADRALKSTAIRDERETLTDMLLTIVTHKAAA